MTRPLDGPALAAAAPELCDCALAGVVGMLAHFRLRLEAILGQGPEYDQGLSRALDDVLVAYAPLRDELLTRQAERHLPGACA